MLKQLENKRTIESKGGFAIIADPLNDYIKGQFIELVAIGCVFDGVVNKYFFNCAFESTLLEMFTNYLFDIVDPTTAYDKEDYKQLVQDVQEQFGNVFFELKELSKEHCEQVAEFQRSFGSLGTRVANSYEEIFNKVGEVLQSVTQDLKPISTEQMEEIFAIAKKYGMGRE